MPKNSFLQALFSGPKFSLAPIEENNRGSVKIGQIVPVWSTVLNPREGVELNMSHLVRFLPAKAPVMEGYKVTFDAFAVPYSCLGYADRKERDIDDFFNLKENGGLIENPFCYPMSRAPFAYDTGENGIEPEDVSIAHAFRLGSLGDYINFPSLKNVRDHVRKWIQQNHLLDFSFPKEYFEGYPSSSQINNTVSQVVLSSLINDVALSSNGSGASIILPEQTTMDLSVGVPFVTSESALILINSQSGYSTPNTELFATVVDEYVVGSAFFRGAFSLFGYILRNYPEIASYYHFVPASVYTAVRTNAQSMANYLVDNFDSLNFDYLQVLYDNYKIDAQSIFNEYFEYIMSLVLYNPDLVNGNGNTLYYFPEGEDDEFPEDSLFLPTLADSDPVDLSYLAAYWKIISDWYINTNIDGDPNDFYLSHCCLLQDSEYSTRPTRFVDMKPFTRRWSNDIFTSAVPMAQIQNIRIPADGTIPDLRESNAYQKLVDILRNTGRRLADVVFGTRGVRPSAIRSEMSEPIATKSSWVGFQSVLQTSQTTIDSPQAAYSGIGTDSNGFGRFFKYINNDEPTPVVIMVLMSVTQHASYMQGFDRKFFRKSIYDFAVPQLAMIGEQEVTNKEVYFDKAYEGGVFGFNRRYYDWFYSGSQVHGDLRDSMDYWHGARIFDEQPALNSEFIGINFDTDHLQRIFANTSEAASPILYNISFDGYATRSLPRYIQYEL